jgi:chemotaxis protein MotA
MMEKSTVIGLFLGFGAIAFGMIFKGASLLALWNPAAIIIIFGGTAASLFIGFPMSELKNFPTLLKLTFIQPKLPTKVELIDMIIAWGKISRREGLLALEDQVNEIDDPFIKKGILLLIDGKEPEFVESILMEEIYEMEERHRKGALLFSQAGTYSPTLGVLGAVIGLIAALGNLSDIEKLGQSIAAAFVATLLGIFAGYVLWHPIANKLKLISKKEVELKQIIVEGVLSVQSGLSATDIEQKLTVFLTKKEQMERNLQQQGGVNNGQETQAAS